MGPIHIPGHFAGAGLDFSFVEMLDRQPGALIPQIIPYSHPHGIADCLPLPQVTDRSEGGLLGKQVPGGAALVLSEA